MIFAKSLILLFSFTVVFSQKKKDFTCVPMDVCQCMFQNGRGINLRGLEVTFQTTNTLFNFHPCTNNFPPENAVVNRTVALNECKGGSSLCFYNELDLNNVKMINLGTADSFEFQSSIDGKEISLRSNYNGWSTTIYLECSKQTDQGALAVRLIDVNNQKVELTLISENSCLTYEFSSIKLSRGAVFFIVICTLLLVYFVGGSLFNWFLFDAQGVDMIPNYSFWSAVLSRILEIPSYCVSCGRASHGYEEI